MLKSPPDRHRSRHELWREEGGDPYVIVVSGWAMQAVTTTDGRRQILSFHLPGDIVRLPTDRDFIAPITLEAIGPLETHFVSLAMLRDLVRAQIDWMDRVSLIEGIWHHHIALRTARLTAFERLANLLLEIHTRLDLAGLARPDGFDCPVTQEQLGDALGLSTVHVNRVLRQMRLMEIVEIEKHHVHFLDRTALEDVAEFWNPVGPNFGDDVEAIPEAG